MDDLLISTNDNVSFVNDKYGDKFDNKSELNSDCKVQWPSSDHSILVLRLRGRVSDDTPVRHTRDKVWLHVYSGGHFRRG